MWSSCRLDAENLTLPKLHDKKLTFLNDGNAVEDYSIWLKRPFADSDIIIANATVRKQVKGDDKDLYFVDLQLPSDKQYPNEPGDTIGILTENSNESVDRLLDHISEKTNADDIVRVECGNLKKSLPKITTRRILLKYFVNYATIPQKLFLRALAEHCTNPSDKRILHVLCSREGSELYRRFILEEGISAYQIITTLPSCKPPVTLLVEMLPLLLPRPYSIANSSMACPSVVQFLFTARHREKEGLCTGMMRRAAECCDQFCLSVYFRQTHGFRLPDDPAIPMILIGLGTGISPYIGFLQQRSIKRSDGKVYLISGFRRREDCLFYCDIEDFMESGVLTKCFLTYSRENDESDRYVQDVIERETADLGSMIVNEGAVIYECGDASIKRKGVTESFVNVLMNYMGITHEEAIAEMKTLREKKRYIQDIWC